MFGFAEPFGIWLLLTLVVAAVLLTTGLGQAVNTEMRQARMRKSRVKVRPRDQASKTRPGCDDAEMRTVRDAIRSCHHLTEDPDRRVGAKADCGSMGKVVAPIIWSRARSDGRVVMCWRRCCSRRDARAAAGQPRPLARWPRGWAPPVVTLRRARRCGAAVWPGDRQRGCGVHASALLGDEPLEAVGAGAVHVVPAGRAVARRAARHRADRGDPGRVQGLQAGHLDGAAPDAVLLADHEPLGAMRAPVASAGAAVARRGARHREDPGEPALVQGPQAGHLDRLAPPAVRLADHEPLLVAACRPGRTRRPRSCPPRRTTPSRPRRPRPCSGPPGRAPRSPGPTRRSVSTATNPCPWPSLSA